MGQPAPPTPQPDTNKPDALHTPGQHRDPLTIGGCIIADSVRLGKTFEALAIIKYHERRNDRVLALSATPSTTAWPTCATRSPLSMKAMTPP